MIISIALSILSSADPDQQIHGYSCHSTSGSGYCQASLHNHNHLFAVLSSRWTHSCLHSYVATSVYAVDANSATSSQSIHLVSCASCTRSGGHSHCLMQAVTLPSHSLAMPITICICHAFCLCGHSLTRRGT